MAHRSSWPPVYPGLTTLPPEQIHTGSPRYLVSDTSTLVAVAGSTAILTYIAQHAIHNAAEYCRKHNLSFANGERLHEYLRQRSVDGVIPPVTHDVTGRVEGGGEQAAKPTRKRPRLGESVT